VTLLEIEDLTVQIMQADDRAVPANANRELHPVAIPVIGTDRHRLAHRHPGEAAGAPE
jgi:hypothetical protein